MALGATCGADFDDTALERTQMLLEHYSGRKITVDLREQQADKLFHMKGVLAARGQDKRYILQGVHSLIEFRSAQPWGNELRSSQLVFIGRDLDRASLNERFQASLIG